MTADSQIKTDKPEAEAKMVAISDGILQELRNVLALHCRDVLMSTKSDGLKSEAQANLLQKIFHGSAGYSSVLDALLQGKGYYAALYRKLELESNRPFNEERKDGMMLELLPIFHLNDGTSCEMIDVEVLFW